MAVDKSFKVKNGLQSLGTIAAPASTASLSPLSIPHGATVTSPGNGDVWTTTTGMFVQINGAAVGPLGPGIVTSASAPSTTSVLWLDTSTTGNEVIPAGGNTGEILAKNSATDYDTGWTRVAGSDLFLALHYV